MSDSLPNSPPDTVWNAANKRAYREGQMRAYVDNSPTVDIFKRETIVLSEAYNQGRNDYAKQTLPSLNWVDNAHEHAEYAIFGPGTGSGPEGDLPPAVVVYMEALTRELEHYALRAVFAEERTVLLQRCVLFQHTNLRDLQKMIDLYFQFSGEDLLNFVKAADF